MTNCRPLAPHLSSWARGYRPMIAWKPPATGGTIGWLTRAGT